MSDNDQIGTIRIRSNLLGELIVEKNSHFNSLVENLKKFEGYSTGAKETADKIMNYAKTQKLEISSLSSQKKLHPELAKFAEAILDKIVIAAGAAGGEGEKLFFTKQGEAISIKQEAEKLNSLKTAHDLKIKELELLKKKEEAAQQVSASSNEEKVEKKRGPKPRPDKNPNTKIGRAAMDIMERRKKNKPKT